MGSCGDNPPFRAPFVAIMRASSVCKYHVRSASVISQVVFLSLQSPPVILLVAESQPVIRRRLSQCAQAANFGTHHSMTPSPALLCKLDRSIYGSKQVTIVQCEDLYEPSSSLLHTINFFPPNVGSLTVRLSALRICDGSCACWLSDSHKINQSKQVTIKVS